MNASLRRNACPSLAAPMQTGDGLLVRLSMVAGSIAPSALRSVAKSAARHGNGILEVTRRGSLQIRGLTAESSSRLAADIEGLGIDLLAGVPVQIGPLAGLDTEELTDPRPLADRLRVMIARAGLTNRLGPKVSIVVDGGGQFTLHDVIADVRLTAVPAAGGRIGWAVAVGPDMEAVAVADAEDAAVMAVALLTAIAALGRSARAKDLSGAAVATTLGSRPAQTIGAIATLPSSVPTRARLPIGDFRLERGWTGLGIGLPFGQADAMQIRSIAQAAERCGVTEFRLAPNRGLIAVCTTNAAAEDLRILAEGLGFAVDPDDPRLRVVACAGARACGSAHIATKPLAADLASGLAYDGTIHISGCRKRCAEPEDPRYTLLGMSGGVAILEGKAGREIARVAESETAAAFRRVINQSQFDKGQ